MNQVYLALGSNLEPRFTHMLSAIKMLQHAFPENFTTSSLYETAPFCGMDQPPYLNCCVCFSTELTAREVFNKTSQLETQLGRKRTAIRWEPRSIDIDLAVFGDEVIDEPDLVIPHYDLMRRDFFLIPLLELSPSLNHPGTGLSLKKALRNVQDELRTHPVKCNSEILEEITKVG